ncbi:site-specific integrase [Clostridium sp. AM30-24]|nr:site-specific integrase [Clostridium sp. AM30-24]RHT37790.1 site-specific integrase [Clostridium sp. AM30-24]
MAYIRKRKNSYSVVYRVKNVEGIEHQKSESYATQKEAEKRKKEIEYKQSLGTFVVPKCTRVKELVREYVRIYGHNEWGVSTYDGNIGLINNYILPTIGETPLSEINNHFMEKYYASLLKMPAVKSTRNMNEDKMITAATVHQIHKVLRSCFRQAVKWEMMDKNPAIDATLPKYKAEEREIWTAEMLMQAIDACENKWLKVAFHLAFAATVRIGELPGLTWDCVDVSEEAIAENRAYIFINKQVERVSRNAVNELDSKEVILIFPSQRKNNKTVRLLKTPKTDTSERKVYIPKFVAQILVDIKKEQDELKDILGSEYQDYNLVMATTFGLPIEDSYLRDQMQKVIDEQGLPDVVFHSLRHTSVTYKLKLSGGDIKAVQGDSGHAQADMVTEVYGHIIDEDRRKNAQRMEDAFYNRENLNPQMKGTEADRTANTVAVPDGVDADLLMKVLGNPEMAALLTSLAKSLKAE